MYLPPRHASTAPDMRMVMRNQPLRILLLLPAADAPDPRVPRGGVTRQGVVLNNLESLVAFSPLLLVNKTPLSLSPTPKEVSFPVNSLSLLNCQ